jgi:lysozyme
LKWILSAALTIAAAAALAAHRNALLLPATDDASEFEPQPEVEQGATWLDDMVTTIDPSTYMTPAVPPDVAQANLAACLHMVKFAEGTAGRGDDGYNILFGGSTFDSYADHPRRAVQFTDRAGRRLWTSAAGAYQFMAVSVIPTGGRTRVNTWDRLQQRLQLPDFSPASQDAAAIELIRERGALGDAMAGRIPEFVRKCAPIWASLPGAGYAQPERKLSSLLHAYQAAGGITEA